MSRLGNVARLDGGERAWHGVYFVPGRFLAHDVFSCR